MLKIYGKILKKYLKMGEKYCLIRKLRKCPEKDTAG